MSWNIKQERDEMDIVDNRFTKDIDSTVVDSEVVDEADVQDWGTEEGETPIPGPTLDFGTKAVLSAEETRQIVLDRIKEHEEAVAVDECLLFEHRFGGGDDKSVIVARIAARYELIQAYVNEYNRIYGGSENG